MSWLNYSLVILGKYKLWLDKRDYMRYELRFYRALYLMKKFWPVYILSYVFTPSSSELTTETISEYDPLFVELIILNEEAVSY